MLIIDRLISNFVVSVNEARILAKINDVRKAFEKYSSSIAAATALVTEENLKQINIDNKKLETTLKDLFSNSAITTFETLSKNLFKNICCEAIDFAISHNLKIEALSIIEILKSQKLKSELIKTKLQNTTPNNFLLLQGDFTADDVKNALSFPNGPIAFFCFYLEPYEKELHLFIIYRTDTNWECERFLICKGEKLYKLLSNINSYIKKLSSFDLTQSKLHLDIVLSSLETMLQGHIEKLLKYGIKKLIIVPHGTLHQIPIHAIRTKSAAKSEFLISSFEKVVYIPSIQLYFNVISGKNPELWDWSLIGLFDIDQLNFGPASLSLVRTLFHDLDPILIIHPIPSILNKIEGKTIIHIDSHGIVNEDDFMNSHILLYKDQLAFKDVIRLYDLRASNLVVLNACSTGLNLNPDRHYDEYYGLDGAFLAKGTLNVISTLGPVLDIAAFLIMYKTYYNMRFERLDVSSALQKAQIWLYSGGWKEEAKTIVEVCEVSIDNYNNEFSEELKKSIRKIKHFLENSKITYFNHSIYWAQWKCSGFGENYIPSTKFGLTKL